MPTANDILNIARSQLGVSENPKGSNSGTPYHAWWGQQGIQWCSIFVSWCFRDHKELIHGFSAYSGDILKAGIDAGEEVTTEEAGPGDIIVFDYGDGGITDHIGIVEKRLGPTTFQIIEGNIGDKVDRRNRTEGPKCLMWFTRPRYQEEEPEMSQSSVQANIRLGTTWKTVNLGGGPRKGKVYVNLINNGSELAHVKTVVQMSPSGIYGERATDVPVARNNVPGFVNFEVGEKFNNPKLGDFSLEFSADQPMTVKVTQEMI